MVQTNELVVQKRIQKMDGHVLKMVKYQTLIEYMNEIKFNKCDSEYEKRRFGGMELAPGKYTRHYKDSYENTANF